MVLIFCLVFSVHTGYTIVSIITTGISNRKKVYTYAGKNTLLRKFRYRGRAGRQIRRIRAGLSDAMRLLP